MLSLNRKETMIVDSPIEIKCPNWCNTESRVMKYTLKWILSNGRSLLGDDASPLKSLPFCMGDNDEITAHLTLYPAANGRDSVMVFGSESYLSLYLQFVTRPDAALAAKLRFEMRNYHTRIKEMIVGKDTVTPGIGWGFQEMYERSSLHNDDLTVLCDISLVVKKTPTDQANNEQIKVLDDLRSLYETESFSDLTFNVGGHVLSAHKGIVAARSPVFAAMLQCEMEEKKSSVIHINDINVKVIKAMLYFIYTGNVDDLVADAEGLLVAADKYGLDDLKTMCEDSLSRNLTPENSSQIFQLADLQRAVQLKSKVVNYIVRNIHEVQLTESWKQMKNTCSDLIIEAFIER